VFELEGGAPEPALNLPKRSRPCFWNANLARRSGSLAEFLRLERKRVPGRILSEADRLEYLFLGGFDPHFEGDEPPGQ
jgi:hypothetical protein